MTLRGKVVLFGGGLLLGVLGAVGLLSPTTPLLALLGAGGLVFLGAMGVVLERGLARPIRTLSAYVRALPQGDLSLRPPDGPYPPELTELEASLRDLADDVGSRVSELKRERDELQGLVDAIAEGVIALTPDARVLRVNRAAADLLALSPPALFAPVGALVRHPDLRDHLEESVLKPLPPREVLVGERNLLISTHFLEGGGSVVTLLDVTGIRRMEQVRRDFVANASHELKTPLTAIRGFAETLLEGDPPEHLKEQFLESICTNTLRLQNLVDNLLDLSRLESGGWSAEEEEVEVSEAAEEAWEQVRGDRPHRSVSFQVEGRGTAVADRQALHQIFRNLYDNSLRYTKDGGRIRVRVAPADPDVRVSVSDTGAGIPSSALPRIFERFYRADSGRDRKAGGTGLGLAIVRHLVQSMAGEVWAESQLGRGTTIHFSLPRAGEARSGSDRG